MNYVFMYLGILLLTLGIFFTLQSEKDKSLGDNCLYSSSQAFSCIPPLQDFNKAFCSVHANSLAIFDQFGRIFYSDNCW